MKVFKIRCSAIGHIMTTGKGSITEKQLQLLNDLQAKEKRTDKQEDTLKDLIHKRDNPELSHTCKSYCEDWLKSQIYGRKLEFTSKYTDKGLIMEDESIDFISKYLNIGMLFKNEQRHEDEFMTGETDIEIPKNNDLIIDAKNSWSWETFPLLSKNIPNERYWWQGQGYMNLTGRKHYKLIYTLSNTPVHLIEREAKSYCWNNGYDGLDIDIYNQFFEKMTYNDVADKFKIKIFEFDRDDKAIEQIKKRVIECRGYIERLKQDILEK